MVFSLESKAKVVNIYLAVNVINLQFHINDYAPDTIAIYIILLRFVNVWSCLVKNINAEIKSCL